MQKNYDKHEIKWENSIFITWEIEAKNFSTADTVAAFIDELHYKNFEPHTRSDYREVWQRDNDYYVVVSWFHDRDGESIWGHFSRAKDFYADEGIHMDPMKLGFGRHFSEEGACFKKCVKILESIDGNLVAVSQLRKTLSKIQGFNGYALHDENEDEVETILAAE